MGLLTRRNPFKAIETEIATLKSRRERVLERLADASKASDAANAEQRRLLVEMDGVDAATLRRAGDACQRAANEKAVIEAAARELADMVADAEARLASEIDRVERDKAAKEMESGADRIEVAAQRFHDAARELDLARMQMADVVQADAPADPITQFKPLGLFVRAAAHVSGLQPLADIERELGSVDSPTAAAAKVCGEMRLRAEAIRKGESAIPAPERRVPRIGPPVLFSEIMVVLDRPAFYRGHLGNQIELPTAGGWTLPEPIAARAIEMGVGFSPSSREGKDILAILRDEPTARLDRRDDGGFRGVRFNGVLGDDGKAGPSRNVVGIVQAPPPADLGSLPDASGVVFSEAAQ